MAVLNEEEICETFGIEKLTAFQQSNERYLLDVTFSLQIPTGNGKSLYDQVCCDDYQYSVIAYIHWHLKFLQTQTSFYIFLYSNSGILIEQELISNAMQCLHYLIIAQLALCNFKNMGEWYCGTIILNLGYYK